MAQSKTIEESLAEIRELIRTYEEVSGTEIPRSVQEARKQGWQLIPKGIVIAGLTAYEHDERKADSTRVIPLPVALQILEDFEDGLITKTVLNPKQIFVRKVRGLVRIVRALANGIPLLWDLAKATVDLWDILDLLAYLARLGFVTDFFSANSRSRAFVETMFELMTRFGVLMITSALAALALPVFNRTVLDVEKEREFWVAKARKAALPQRNQRRVWRRKVSRL